MSFTSFGMILVASLILFQVIVKMGDFYNIETTQYNIYFAFYIFLLLTLFILQSL
jgi:hypothetical protein